MGPFLDGKHRRRWRYAVRCRPCSSALFTLTCVDGSFSCGDVDLVRRSCRSSGQNATGNERHVYLRTPVVQSRTDVDVGPLRGTQVGKRRLDGVVRAKL